jgi:hypothetical protein
MLTLCLQGGCGHKRGGSRLLHSLLFASLLGGYACARLPASLVSSTNLGLVCLSHQLRLVTLARDHMDLQSSSYMQATHAACPMWAACSKCFVHV